MVGGVTLASLVVLVSPSIPLGIPGEWTWARRGFEGLDVPTCLLGLLLCAGYGGVVRWGEVSIRRRRGEPGSVEQQEWTALTGRAREQPVEFVPTWGSRLRSEFRIAGLCLLAFIWFFGLLCLQPDIPGLGRSPTILYYKRTEGYFWQAAFDAQNTQQFLRSYRDSIASGDDPDRYLHLGTHPPGLTLMYRGLLSLFEGSPELAGAVISLEPNSIREAFAALRQFPTPKGQLTLAEEATLWSATLLTLFAVAGACWPIYRLTARMSDAVTAWRAAALWPLVPSLLVFFPKSDLFCPVIATMSCWLWLDGWSRLRWGRCVLAGVGFFCGLMLTLALAPIALLLVVQTILERWTRRQEFSRRSPSSDVGCVLAAVAGFGIPLGTLAYWGQCNPLAIWMQNLENHGMFYDHNTRSYLGWLVVNLFEAAFALGLPIACLGLVGAAHVVQGHRSRHIAISQFLAWFGVWAILWLSGKNMGEAARLWIFIAPWPVMTAAMALSPKRDANEESSSLAVESSGLEGFNVWGVLLALQLLACVWTMSCLDGFHMRELMPP